MMRSLQRIKRREHMSATHAGLVLRAPSRTRRASSRTAGKCRTVNTSRGFTATSQTHASCSSTGAYAMLYCNAQLRLQYASQGTPRCANIQVRFVPQSSQCHHQYLYAILSRNHRTKIQVRFTIPHYTACPTCQTRHLPGTPTAPRSRCAAPAPGAARPRRPGAARSSTRSGGSPGPAAAKAERRGKRQNDFTTAARKSPTRR